MYPYLGIRKDALMDALHLSHLHINCLFPDIVMLVLILRLYLLSNAVEFFIAFLSVQLLLILLIHFLTSDIVCEKWYVLCIGKAPRRVPQTVDKVGAGSYPQHHFSVNSLCFNKNLKKLQDSFILDSLISKIFASFFKFIHANVSPAFISIRAFPMY